jgi:hypothetical protein
MTKNAITDYDTDPANNTDVGNIAIEGSDNVANFDNALRENMSHLAEMNSGASPLHDSFTLSDPDDLTKRFRFDGVDVTPGETRVLTVPDKDGTIALAEVNYGTYTTPDNTWLSGVNIKGDTSVNINTIEASCTRIGNFAEVSIHLVIDGFSVTAYDDSSIIFYFNIADLGTDAGWFTAVESEFKCPIYVEWDADSGDYPPWVARGHMDNTGSLGVYAGDTQFGYSSLTANQIELTFNLSAKVSGDWTAT